jgi:hypothetical protein
LIIKKHVEPPTQLMQQTSQLQHAFMLFLLHCLKSMFSAKGGTSIQGAINTIYFERIPSGEVQIRPFNKIPKRGSKLRNIGRDGTHVLLENAIKERITA